MLLLFDLVQCKLPFERINLDNAMKIHDEQLLSLILINITNSDYYLKIVAFFLVLLRDDQLQQFTNARKSVRLDGAIKCLLLMNDLLSICLAYPRLT